MGRRRIVVPGREPVRGGSEPMGMWVRKHAAEGPQGLERVACGPAKRRRRALLPAPVRAEVVAVQQRSADFGLK